MTDKLDNINNLKHLSVKESQTKLQGKITNWENVCKYMTRIIILIVILSKVKKSLRNLNSSIKKWVEYTTGN